MASNIRRRLDRLELAIKRARELEKARLRAQLAGIWLQFTDEEMDTLELAATRYISGADLLPDQAAIFEKFIALAGDIVTSLNELEDMRALCEIAGVDYDAYIAGLANDPSPGG